MEELENLKDGFETLKNDISPEIEGLKDIKGKVDSEIQNLKGLKKELDPEDQENKDVVKSERQPEEVMSPESPMSPMRKRVLELQEQENADLQKADIEKAQEHALHNTLRKEGKKFKWNCSVDEFLNCGVGIPLYLKFLKDMAIICVVLAIVAIPAIIGNRLGNGYPDSAPTIDKTTLGNQKDLSIQMPAGMSYQDFFFSQRYAQKNNETSPAINTDLAFDTSLEFTSQAITDSKTNVIAEQNDPNSQLRIEETEMGISEADQELKASQLEQSLDEDLPESDTFLDQPGGVGDLQSEPAGVSDGAEAYGTSDATDESVRRRLTYNASSDDYHKFINHNIKIKNSYYANVQQNFLLAIVPDLIYSIFFFVFLIYVRVRNQKYILLQEKRKIFINDFAVKVEGILMNHFNIQKIREHFSQFGEIEDVSLGKNHFNTLLVHTKLAEVEQKLRYEKARQTISKKKNEKILKDLYSEKIDALKEIRDRFKKNPALKSNYDDFPPLVVFVTFKKTETAELAIQQYRVANKFSLKNFILRKKPKECYPSSQLLFEKEFGLKVTRPPVPDDLLWENLECPWYSRAFRGFIGAWASVFFIFISYVVIFISEMFTNDSTKECPKNYEKYSASTRAQFPPYMDYICFCATQSYITILHSKEIRTKCFSYAVKAAGFEALSVASALILTFTNEMISKSIDFLTRFQRFSTRTQENASVVFKSFFSTFINAAIIPILFNGRFGGYLYDPKSGIILQRSIMKIIPPIGDLVAKDANQFPADFDREWYKTIGHTLVYYFILQLAKPYIISTIKMGFSLWRRPKKVKTSIIQGDMNDAAAGPELDIRSKYSSCILALYLTLFFCSGMPILIFFSALFFIGLYWIEKLSLIHYYRKPKYIGHTTNTMAVQLIPFALMVHVAVALFAYGSESIFITDVVLVQNTETSPLPQFISNDGSSMEKAIEDRIVHLIEFFVVFLIFFILWILDITLLRVFTKIYANWREKRIHKVTVVPTDSESIELTIDHYRKDLELQGVATYNMLQNPKYRKLVDSIELFSTYTLEELDKIIKDDMELRKKEGRAADTFWGKIKKWVLSKIRKGAQETFTAGLDEAKELGKDIKVPDFVTDIGKEGKELLKDGAEEVKKLGKETGITDMASKAEKSGISIVNDFNDLVADGNKEKSDKLKEWEKKALEKGEENLKSKIKEKVDEKVQETEKKLATKVIGQKNMDRLEKANEYLTGDMNGDGDKGKDDKGDKGSDDKKDQKGGDGEEKKKSGFGQELWELVKEGKKQSDEENNKKN